MNAQLLSTCVSPCQTLSEIFEKGYFTGSKTPRKAGKTVKKAIVNSGSFDKFTMFKDWHVKTYRLKHNGRLYAVVVHSAIEHLFEIN